MDEVFITKIIIEKVRHLENIEIAMNDSQRKHLIITGKNGSGKTSFLSAIKSFLNSIYNNHSPFISTELFDTMCLNIRSRIGIMLSFNSMRHIRNLSYSGHFIIIFFDVKRLIQLKIPTGISKIELKPRYDIDERANQNFIQYIVNLKADQAFARNENDIESVRQIDE